MECETIRQLLPAYGDNELSVESAVEVERHLHACARCRAALARQRTFSETVGRLYPRAPLPPGLEDRVRRTLRTAPGTRFWLGGLALAAAAVLVFGAVWTLMPAGVPDTPASVLAAAAVHRSACQQPLPLAIHSADAAAVNGWLSHALPFPINAPVRKTSNLTLEGAATVDLASERVGYVQYRHDAHQISLFLLPPRPWPQGGQRVHVHDVEFHLFTIDGLNLIAWNHPPLSYVLVSDLGGQGGQACAVCHDSMADAAMIGAANDGAI